MSHASAQAPKMSAANGPPLAPILAEIRPYFSMPAATAPQTKKYSSTDRYAPCPCHSGKTYKFCCGKTGR
jgi:uncharacterized protein YecA (UPF0149 family)